MISPANTSAALTEYADRGFYARTAASDLLQARALADVVHEDGFRRIALLARAGDYGRPIRDALEDVLPIDGVALVAVVDYEPDVDSVDELVRQVVSSDPDAVVVIGLSESGRVIEALAASGLSPRTTQFYGMSGNMGDRLADAMRAPETLACMKGTVPFAATPAELERRLLRVDDTLTTMGSAVEAYDAVVIAALAAQVAGTDDGEAIAAVLADVTRGGQRCTSFSTCVAVLRSAEDGGADIDYDGLGGPYELSDRGDPTVAEFGIAQFDRSGRLVVLEHRTASA